MAILYSPLAEVMRFFYDSVLVAAILNSFSLPSCLPLHSATPCPSRSILKSSWIHMAVLCAAPHWQIPPRIPSSLWLVMNACTYISLMNEGPALPSMDTSCWPTGTVDICFYSSGMQSHPTSKNNTE